jgi:hypothetical protein
MITGLGSKPNVHPYLSPWIDFYDLSMGFFVDLCY